ncbi:helix-turn-helix transcriptional regulator [Hyalangium minutum]|uniref:Transcriptional regulator, DeoR family protein n=1 Tax=Hyalangium minutum TaxID=394096 RepID=A0A085W320_9BACT|nr:YafY family protein [Hyalangium minutum]KFE62083.1 Transcriptional regulator, DeoR family protein [Hyalangium minutum]
MRADRLIQLLMLLQTRPRWTAGELAQRLEVSERTIYRDLDALSASGVPVLATRGPTGGVSLMEGWRTQLTGLTREEVHALATVGTPRLLEDLGLSAPLRSGLVKLAAALPSLQQSVIEYARQRIHADPSSWFAEREPVPHLAVLRDAVWQNHRVRLDYRDFDGKPSKRVVDPYGLVIKAERWYLVAGTERGPSVFRGARIAEARLLSETFVRPERFDLPTFWKEWCSKFAERRAQYEVTLRLAPDGAEALRHIRPPNDQARIAEARRARDGTKTVTIDFERESIALSQLCGLGRGVEVLAPKALRDRLRTIAADLQALYGSHSPASTRQAPAPEIMGAGARKPSQKTLSPG